MRCSRGFFGGDSLGFDAGDVLSELLALLGNGVELVGVGRAAGDLFVVSIEAEDAFSDLSNQVFTLEQCRFKTLELSAGFSRSVRDFCEVRIGVAALVFGFVEFVAGGFFLQGCAGLGLLELRDLRLKPLQRVLGFRDLTIFALDVGLKLFGAAVEFFGARCRALSFAFEIFLLDLEARDNGGGAGLRIPQRWHGFGQLQFAIESFGFRFRCGAEARHGFGERGFFRVHCRLCIRP